MDPDALAYALDHGLDAGRVDDSGRTLGHVAAELGLSDHLAAILRAGLDPDIRDDRGDTVLHWAVRSGDPATINVALDYMASPSVSNEDGALPRALTDDPAIHESLADQGAALELFQAVQKRNVRKARRVLQKSPGLLARTPLSSATLSAAIGHIVHAVMDAVVEGEPVEDVVARERDLFDLLVDEGAAVDGAVTGTLPPLHKAAQIEQSATIAKELVERGARPGRLHEGQTPLDVASRGAVKKYLRSLEQ